MYGIFLALIKASQESQRKTQDSFQLNRSARKLIVKCFKQFQGQASGLYKNLPLPLQQI